MKIEGLGLDATAKAADEFAALVGRQVVATMRTVTRAWRGHPTLGLDDLGGTKTEWERRVDEHLIPALNEGYWASVDAVAEPVIAYHTEAGTTPASQTAAADLGDIGQYSQAAKEGVTIGRAPFTAAEQYMADASNRLVRVGDVIWEQARAELVAGMSQGEGVRELSARVARVAPELAMPRAEVIARTESNGARNAGAMSQVRAMGGKAEKYWDATGDIRTRPDHAQADGQHVPLDQPFMVGGYPMDHPHDHNAPASEVVNCRCVVSFELDPDTVPVLEAGGERLITDPYNDVPQPGQAARYAPDAERPAWRQAFTEAELRANVPMLKADQRKRILKLNQVLGERFGQPFTKVERISRGNAIAHVRTDWQGNVTLGLRASYLTDEMAYRSRLAHFHPIGADHFEEFLVHEHGHYILMSPRGLPYEKNGQLGMEAVDAGTRWWEAKVAANKAAKAAGMPDTIRGIASDLKADYAKTNTNEAEAELWASYHMGGPNRPPWVVAWGESFLRELGLDTTPLCVDLGMCP